MALGRNGSCFLCCGTAGSCCTARKLDRHNSANRYLRGRWSAQVPPATKNAANGSWTLFNERNQTVLQGTWSVRKTAGGWQGTWSARIKKGRTVSGTWNAAMADFNGKTFEDMLKRTARNKLGAPGKVVARREIGGFNGDRCAEGSPEIVDCSVPKK